MYIGERSLKKLRDAFARVAVGNYRAMSLAVVVAACCCFAALPARAESREDGARNEAPQNQPTLSEKKLCSASGMKQAEPSEEFVDICEPHGETVLAKITACLAAGMEAVLVLDHSGVVCAPPSKGGVFLDKPRTTNSKEPRYSNPHLIDADFVCDRSRRASEPDRRILDAKIVKDIVRESKVKLDPNGVRIIGGIYCDGLDLTGLDLPFSLVLDRSIFKGDVNIRNFRTAGDVAVDNAVSYTKFSIKRAQISGSFFAQVAFFNDLYIENSNINGSIRINGTVISRVLSIDGANVSGDVDLSKNFVSYLDVLKNNIGNVLDLGQSQARCTYDIRKNEIGDMVAVQLGFGRIDPEPVNGKYYHYLFRRVTNDADFGRPLDYPKDPYDRYMEPGSGTGAMMRAAKNCLSRRSIRPGTFMLVDNHIRSSLCIRSFNWPIDSLGRSRESGVYLNEAVIGGAAWLNLAQQSLSAAKGDEDKEGAATPELSLLNVKTGTLVLNFGVTAQNLALTFNGLDFERIYASEKNCESAVSLRVGRPKELTVDDLREKPDFPPKLDLPTTEQVIDWINKNKFARTQQPFAEFVAVFERAGNSEGATELKIRAANFALKSSVCGLLPNWLQHAARCLRETASAEGKQAPTPLISPIRELKRLVGDAVHWCEQVIVTALQFVLGLLAEYGYKPQRIGWYVLGSVGVFWAIFRYGLKIVGYSVEGSPDKIKPIGFVFLFDRLLPAYKIREENYKIDRFYVASDKARNEDAKSIKRLSGTCQVVEASEHQHERAERYLDALKFMGFVFAIFIVAAVSRLVR